MKIQCACGTRLAFDVTEDMAVNPVQCICPACGTDNSAMVNQLIRQELGVTSAPRTAPVATLLPTTAPVAAPIAAPPPPPPLAPKPAIRVTAHAPAPAPVEAAQVGHEFCPKHPSKEVAQKCLVCGKPMCLDCMSLFGYVCSPLCRSKATSRGLDIPVYAAQKSVMEAKRWRMIGRLTWSAVAVVVLVLGAWGWYAWWGCRPKVAYSFQFPDKAKSGEVQLVGANNLVYLHGGQLGRIDMKQPQPVWTAQLVDRKSFAALAEKAVIETKKARERYVDETGETDFKVPSADSLMDDMVEAAIESLRLHVAGQNIWIASGDNLTHYDWQTGKPGKKLTLEGGAYGLKRKGDELLLSELDEDGLHETIQHINLASGEVTEETAAKPMPEKLMTLLTNAVTKPAAKGKPATSKPGATGSPDMISALAARVAAANKARSLSAELDPQKIADTAQGMSYAGKLALPVLIANARNQQRIAAELAEQNGRQAPPPTELDKALDEWDATQIIPASDGPVQFTKILLERKLVEREAMKAPPKKPALEGNVSVANSMEVANEMLNEMQRERGSKVVEDHSRYQVTVRRAGSTTPVWTGEVTGSPALHPLKTVDIITAGTTAIALSHENKKVWQAAMNYPVRGGSDLIDEDMDAEFSSSGLGPCIERGDTVFIYDQGSLAAFDLASGNSRWRLPSVGISGLWFDEKGAIYVNTTTAGPDSIRYAKQINIHDNTLTQIIKVDPKTGKTLWSREGAKHIAYMWKKSIYTTDSAEGDGPDGEGLGSITGIVEPAFIRIRRIDTGNGSIVWEYVDKRCPLDVHFHENTIQVLFKKEVQQLKMLTL